MIQELTGGQVAVAFDAIAALRPQVRRENFVDQVASQASDGYRLVAVMEDGEAVAAAGFRFATNLAWGQHCYVDDLSTLERARGVGHARSLLAWIDAEAAAQGISEIHLDSGVQVTRQAAHALYFRNGFRIASYHFTAPTTAR